MRTKNRKVLGSVSSPVEAQRGEVIFVEIFRLLLVITGTVGGLTVGQGIAPKGSVPLISVVLGALFAYVLGGVAGRLLDRNMQGAVERLRARPAAEVFAASVVGTMGLRCLRFSILHWTIRSWPCSPGRCVCSEFVLELQKDGTSVEQQESHTF